MPTPNRESPCIFRVLLESPQPASKNNATDSPGRVLATEPSPLAHGAQVSPKTALFEYHYGRNPHGTSHRVCQCDWPTQNASTSPTQTAIEGRCFPCVPVRSAHPKDLNLMNETILGDHVQHVFLYKHDLNITQQVSLENMLNQTPLAHGVATTLPDALRVRITRKTCCQNQTQRLSQVRVNNMSQVVLKLIIQILIINQ